MICEPSRKFEVRVTREAQADLRYIAFYISESLNAPLSAFRYAKGIESELFGLSRYADSLPIVRSQALRAQYGKSVRRVVFKKHTILYTVDGSVVFVLRIVSSALLKEIL